MKEDHESEDAPISKLQPTPQEEVENALASDNAASTELATEATDPEATAEHETRAETSAVDSVFEGVQSAASSAIEGVQSAASGAFQSVSESRPERSSKSTYNPQEPKSTTYIGNLFFDVTENDLIKDFAKFGEINSCKIMRDARGLSKGFGYIDFKSTEQATQCIQDMNRQLYEGRRINVGYATFSQKDMERKERYPRSNKPTNPPSKTLFIGNMSYEMTDRDLNNLFRGIRNVIDVRVAIDRRTGQPRGFAHADFVDVKSAMEAMKVLEEKETYGRKLRLDYSYGPSNSPRNEPQEPRE